MPDRAATSRDAAPASPIVTWDVFDELSPPYSTIVADPPWPYDGSDALTKTIKRDGSVARGVSAAGHYTLTKMDDLKALPVRLLAADESHLYMWVTNAFLVEAHNLARAWGFTPKTMLTWVKVHQDDPTRVSMKTGYWFRGATEHVLFAVRGSLPLQTDEGIPTAFLWPRIGAHSVKPAAFGDLVERCSPGPYVELFSRAPRLGWDHWGKGYEGPIRVVGAVGNCSTDDTAAFTTALAASVNRPDAEARP